MFICSVIVLKFYNFISVNEIFKRRNILILKFNDVKCMFNFKIMYLEKDKILFDIIWNFEFIFLILYIKL